MTIASPQSPTIDTPRIGLSRFQQLLKSKDSPATDEASVVYEELITGGVEPAFALAQFRVESQYGTSGWARETGSWGNMLWDEHLTTHASGKETFTHSTGATYTFSTYTSYRNAILDYIAYIHWYDTRYGLSTIYGATARWIGRPPGSTGHLSYVGIIVNDIVEYQFPPGTFYETGDKMIYSGDYIDRSTGRLGKRIWVATGTPLFRGTTGNQLKTLQPGIDPATGKQYKGLNCFFLGPVNGSWAWGTVIVSTGSADPKGTVLYIKNPDQTKVTNA